MPPADARARNAEKGNTGIGGRNGRSGVAEEIGFPPVDRQSGVGAERHCRKRCRRNDERVGTGPGKRLRQSPAQTRTMDAQRFVDGGTFQRDVAARCNRQTEYVDEPWTMKDRLVMADRGYTDDADICLIGGMTNGKHVNLFHLIPSEKDHLSAAGWENVVEGLTEDLEKLKADKQPVRGFLLGGWKNDELSVALYDKAKALFESLGMPFTQIGLNRSYTSRDAGYDAATDTWTVCIDNIGMERGYYLNAHDFQTVFEDVRIDPGDTLDLDA